ncbi:hypothetical protein [Clavibacter michiganensis]|uniref:hypothetical protein n=1 Tax=Clavibacter michiganensis TaxID=28447 RepID=UPI0021571FA3|nr:hypothetical protein [Clavibacter michiganensis]
MRLVAIKPAFGDDLEALVKSEGGPHGEPDPLAARVIDLLLLIASGDLRGQPLEERAGTADLSDCRKLYFDLDPREERPEFRLVYRLLPNEDAPTTVQAIAVGYRANLDAYVRAARNLGRL